LLSKIKGKDRGQARSHQTQRKQLILLVANFLDPLNLSKASDASSGRVFEGRVMPDRSPFDALRRRIPVKLGCFAQVSGDLVPVKRWDALLRVSGPRDTASV
jgi:hypothetical protein